jgi:hypothetical protein
LSLLCVKFDMSMVTTVAKSEADATTEEMASTSVARRAPPPPPPFPMGLIGLVGPIGLAVPLGLALVGDMLRA